MYPFLKHLTKNDNNNTIYKLDVVRENYYITVSTNIPNVM